MPKVLESQEKVEKPATLMRLAGSPAGFLRVVALYFGCQVVLRMITSPTADLDESEQLVFAQALRLGYGPQPPLYTWMQWAFFQVFGVSIFSLALLKNLLLFGIYYFTYASARLLSGNPVTAAIAAVALGLFPQISWESQRDLTHTVLATTCAAATLYVFLRLRHNASWGAYGLLGLCFAAGLLANYNYALLAFGLLAGGLAVQPYRRVAWSPRMLAAIGLALLVLLPHLMWIAGHRGLAFSSAHKFDARPDFGWLAAAGMGVKAVGQSALSLTAPALVLLIVLGGGRLLKPQTEKPALSQETKLMLMTLLAPLVATALIAATFKLTGFKGRWFQPLAVVMPVGLAAWLGPRMHRRQVAWLMRAGAAVALAIGCMIPLRIWLAEPMKRHELLNAPFVPLTRQLQAHTQKAAFLAADSLWTAGNLRLAFPRLAVLCPGFVDYSLVRPGEACLVVWDATRFPILPVTLRQVFNGVLPWDAPADAPQFIDAQLRQYQRERMRLGFLMLPWKPALLFRQTSRSTDPPSSKTF